MKSAVGHIWTDHHQQRQQQHQQLLQHQQQQQHQQLLQHQVKIMKDPSKWSLSAILCQLHPPICLS